MKGKRLLPMGAATRINVALHLDFGHSTKLVNCSFAFTNRSAAMFKGESVLLVWQTKIQLNPRQ